MAESTKTIPKLVLSAMKMHPQSIWDLLDSCVEDDDDLSRPIDESSTVSDRMCVRVRDMVFDRVGHMDDHVQAFLTGGCAASILRIMLSAFEEDKENEPLNRVITRELWLLATLCYLSGEITCTDAIESGKPMSIKNGGENDVKTYYLWSDLYAIVRDYIDLLKEQKHTAEHLFRSVAVHIARHYREIVLFPIFIESISYAAEGKTRLARILNTMHLIRSDLGQHNILQEFDVSTWSAYGRLVQTHIGRLAFGVSTNETFKVLTSKYWFGITIPYVHDLYVAHVHPFYHKALKALIDSLAQSAWENIWSTHPLKGMPIPSDDDESGYIVHE